MPSLAQKFFVDSSGSYLGSWTGFKHPDDLALDREGQLILIDGEPMVVSEGATINSSPPLGAIEVPFPPADGRDVWDGERYIPHAEEAKKPDLDALVQALLAKGVITEADLKEHVK